MARRCWSCAREKNCSPCGARTTSDRDDPPRTQSRRHRVSMSKLCQWFGVPRRTLYYRPTKATPAVDPRFAEPIKAMIEENPSSGYRIVAHLLDFNKNGAAHFPAQQAGR
jgi:hypothetical protein